MFYSIDGTDNTRLGRYVNDSPRRFANCYTKMIMVDARPHIAIFAGQDLPAGVEIRYDYGGGDLPWRNVSSMVISLVFDDILLTVNIICLEKVV